MLASHRHPTRPVVGLVLGAGGTRGAAHAAVIQALHEAGIPIDLVVGASVGAMYGLALAAGMPPPRLAQTARAATALDLARFYAGRLRSSRLNPIGRLLFETGAGRHFSDLELPFAVMVTEVLNGSIEAITEGPVLPAVQASISLPFIARSVAIAGNRYVDGGLLDTLPVQVARSMGAEVVVAVCLGYNYLAPAPFRRRPWTQAALQRLGRQERHSPLPAVDQVRFFARLCAATFDPPLPSDDADVTIRPEFGRIGPNSMVGSAFCFDQGLAAAREALPRIERLLAGDVHNAGQP